MEIAGIKPGKLVRVLRLYQLFAETDHSAEHIVVEPGEVLLTIKVERLANVGDVAWYRVAFLYGNKVYFNHFNLESDGLLLHIFAPLKTRHIDI